MENPGTSGTSGGMTGFWNGPVAATTARAAIAPALVSARKRPSSCRVTEVTSTPQRTGIRIFAA